MVFQATISNEQTAALNSAHFDGEIVVVERDEQIKDVCRDLSAQKIIGFDTETRPSFKAGITNKVAQTLCFRYSLSQNYSRQFPQTLLLYAPTTGYLLQIHKTSLVEVT